VLAVGPRQGRGLLAVAGSTRGSRAGGAGSRRVGQHIPSWPWRPESELDLVSEHRSSPAAGYYEFTRPEVIALIPTTARNVLELGCAGGALGAALKQRQPCRVTGLEYVAEVAQRAEPRLDRVLVGDCEALDLDALFQPGEFDCVVAADVLEHLRDPELFLQRLKPFLAPEATIVASIPNVRNVHVLKSVVEGYWTYQDAGILDRTHLRFFTRREIDAMFARLGCTIEERQSVNEAAVAEWQRLGCPANVSFGPLSISGLPAEEIAELFVIQWLVRSRVVGALSPASDKRPGVSIVMLTWNQLEYTRQCVESVLRHTPQPVELIFVDNGSTDGTREYLKTIPNARVVLNDDNLGFAAGNNQGLTLATGDYVVLLNNDTVVTDGWLDRLIGPMLRDATIGFTGPRSNYVAGPQLVPNVPYTSLEELDSFAAERAASLANGGWPTAFAVGFCLAIRRSVVERIGGLDPRFGSGNFEDNDYCLRAVLAGWKGWIADDAFVHHFGHRTFIGAGIDYVDSMSKNGRLYAQKWGLEIDPQTGAPRYPADFLTSRTFEPATGVYPLPTNVSYVDVTPTLAAYHQGVQLLAAGQASLAVEALEQAIAGAPEVADFHNALGAALFEADRLPEAVTALTRAARLAPDDQSIRDNLNEALQVSGS
jgi:GT2 family glycosyltransferase/2-polyprenyl-3-methyl-5-hydroxy-6-metoxy-1,4-benzoquinol methylase